MTTAEAVNGTAVAGDFPSPSGRPELGALAVTIGATTLTVDLGSVNGLEWRAARLASGYPTQADLLAAVDRLEFDALAALFWIAALREDDTVGYAEVLAGCSYSTLRVEAA